MRNKVISGIVLALTLGIAGPAVAQTADDTVRRAEQMQPQESDNSGMWGLLGLIGGLGLLGLKRRDEEHRVHRGATNTPATGYSR